MRLLFVHDFGKFVMVNKGCHTTLSTQGARIGRSGWMDGWMGEAQSSKLK